MTNFVWTPATGSDVDSIVRMAESHFQTEIDQIFTPDPIAYARNITLAIVNQFYLPTTSLVAICKQDQLLAYTWVSVERAPWSDDNMAVIRMAHADLLLPAITRVKLVKDMFTIWENFANMAQIPIICSTTMRKDQDGFLKLHEKHGYDVRGSYAYKKLSA